MAIDDLRKNGTRKGVSQIREGNRPVWEAVECTSKGAPFREFSEGAKEIRYYSAWIAR